MKQYMNRLLTIVAVLLASAGAWAGEVTTIITPNNAGTVQVSQAAAGQTCTITVTPASGYYLTVENLSAVTTLDGGGVQAPSRRGIDFSEEQLTITAKTPDADPSGVTTYEFTMPADESVNVELTAEFQTLIAINPSVSLLGWTYGEDPNEPVVRDNTGNGEETFTYALQGSTDYTTAVPENAGKYTVKATIAAAGKYAAGSCTADFEISKAVAEITKAPAAVANLVYTGSAQTLITAGEAAGGELQYKLGTDGNYAATLPSASAAGKYTVFYKVFGDANHNDVAEASVEVSIDKASIIPEIFIESWEYGSEPNEPKIEGNLGEGDVTISYKAIDADEYTEEIPSAVGDYIVKVVIAETDNYYGAEATAEFSIFNKTLMAEDVFAEGKTYATYYNAEEDMMLPEGVVAYVITGVNGNMLATQALSYIPQNTPVLLEKNEMEVSRNDDFTDNLLRGASTTVDVRRVTDGVVYVLYDNQFVKSVSGSIPVGRAYLVLEKNAVAGARLFFDFSDLTGISIVKADTDNNTAEWYTIDGRKLQQKPSKNGLYINNGKKVAINNK